MANQYLPFATGGSANTMTYSAWASLSSIIANGFQSGVASSEQFNTLMRQVSVPAAGLAQWASDTAGVNANDDGSTANFKALLDSAFSAKLSPYLLKSGGTMTGAITLPNGAVGINVGDDARISDRNIANTVVIEGQTNSDRGYVNFSQTSGNQLGAINGADLTWRGSSVITAENFATYAVPKAGGTMTGGLILPAGTQSAPSLSFSNETSADTGLFSPLDGHVRITNNSAITWTFGPASTTADVPVFLPTAATSTNNDQAASTAFVNNRINNLFTASNGDIGWARSSTGQIEQWGRVAIGDIPTGGTSGTFTFPIAFPNRCNICVISASESLTGANVTVTLGSDPSTTAVTWKANEFSNATQNVTLHIYARGY